MFIINMKIKFRSNSKRVLRHAKEPVERNSSPQPMNQRNSPVSEKVVYLQSVWSSQDGLIKTVRTGFNGIREKQHFISSFMSALTNSITEAASMTTNREARIHIPSLKVDCNAFDKSMPHIGGSKVSTTREDEHINNFDNLTCEILTRAFHLQQNSQHNFSSELNGRVLAKRSLENKNQGPKMMRSVMNIFFPFLLEKQQYGSGNMP